MTPGMAQTVPKIIRNLKDNSKISLQCGALTYIRSNAEKLKAAAILKEEEYSEICRLVMDTITSVDQNTRNEATKALHAVLKHFKTHSLKFFESALKANRKKRLKIFHFLESLDDDTIFATAQDPMTINFANDCLHNVQTNTMEWLLPSACSDNLQMLAQAERRSLSDDQELEELTVDNAIALLQRLYKIALVGTDFESVRRFDTLVMDKIVTLAYMGHKRQRPAALKVMELAIATDLGTHIKTRYSDVWTRYKNDLQGPYSTRMALLVKACESDWSNQWSMSIQLLGTDLHRGATLINNLLSVEERAFKSTDTNVRRQAFVSWKLLVDNFSLDPKELATARRIKLLCVPLTAKNSKSELIALTKLDVWWYLITKLYPNITKFAEPVITQFLNFCFGPLGDTPLLSTKVDVIASPGKRFYKTKVVAVDALLQLMVLDQQDRKALAPILEQRLSNPMSDELFKECYKPFLHSVGEAVVIIDQLNENEISNRETIIKVLLMNLMRYVQSTAAESKVAVHNELVLVLMELQNRVPEISYVNDFVRDIVVPELSRTATAANLEAQDTLLLDLASKIITPKMLKGLQKKHCEAMKALLSQAVKTQGRFRSETLEFVGRIIQELEYISTDKTGIPDCYELWFTCSEISYKYALTEKNINEGTVGEPKFKTIETIVRFPFTHMYSTNSIQAQNIANSWKDLYKQFERTADAIAQVKPNEIFDNTSIMIRECLAKNGKCYRLAIYCLDGLLGTINYKYFLAQNGIPTILRLVMDLTTIALNEGQPAEADCALKALSSLLITVYGHCPEKALAYLKETSQTIDLMLNIDAQRILIKEVTSTWETIVSILRGLGSLLDVDLLESYKKIILSATRHSNAEIVVLSEAVMIAMRENVTEPAKSILFEMEREVKKSLKPKSEKADRAIKQVRTAGSFINRKIPSPRPVSLVKPKEKERLIPLPPEPDSQDYVVILSDVNLDVNRLTDHQKESFKRRRDDIPAMYNDLSQSSSQDTQDLQQWFDGKARKSEEIVANKVADVQPTDKDDDKVDAAKVVEDAAGAPSGDSPATKVINEKSNRDSLSLGTGENECTNDLRTIVESSREFERSTEQIKTKDSQSVKTTRAAAAAFGNPLNDHSYTGTPDPHENTQSPSNENSDEIVPKRLDFESRDEYPEDTDKSGERELRSKKGLIATHSSFNVQETRARKRQKRETVNPTRVTGDAREESSSGAEGIQKRGVGRPRGIAKQSSQPANNAERGAKRKAASDSDAETSERTKRLRRKSSRSPSDASNEAAPIVAPTDKRTEIEMSRLRIDMVFDGPLPPRRRSKTSGNNEHASTDIRNQGKRNNSPETKNTRGKNAVETRGTDGNHRRNLRGPEKLAKEGGGNRADFSKKRRRRSSNQIVQDNSVSQTIVDDDNDNDETCKDSPVWDATVEKLVECAEEIAKIVSTTTTTTTTTATATAPSVKDDDEVVESSQIDSSVSGVNLKAIIPPIKFEKPNITGEIDPTDCSNKEMTVPRASSPINPLEEVTNTTGVLAKRGGLTDEKPSHNDSDDSEETFLDISAIRSQDQPAAADNAEKKATEENKTNGTSGMVEHSFNFSSPKNPSKRFSKPKAFAIQGRAAHMLGLVTKLAVVEKDCCDIEKNHADEEARSDRIVTKKDNPPRSLMFKDPNERMASPGGSRQEKIFNNMKAADYGQSPPGNKLFANLRNNGEKISPKMEKFDGEAERQMDSSSSDASSARGDDEENNISQPNERDELPILEWSSANPPSLTASPSASILKRNNRQQSISIENFPVEVETTPNKSLRKRVSFADPPVSKEMGYEVVASGGSPLRTTKFTSRSLFGGKNSPLRIKQQSKFKIIQIDAEKTETDVCRLVVPSSVQVDIDCERDNALLVKIADDLEDTAEFRSGELSLEPSIPEVSCGIVENSKKEQEEADDNNSTAVVGPKNSIIDDIETQDDLFNSSDEKRESPNKDDVSTDDDDNNSTIDSLKLNVTDDSVLRSITNVIGPCDYDENNRSAECLEDTVDVRNITALNSSTNSDEMFCEKPARTNIQVPDGISQMDTLPVTDSIFASLPSTQDSQDSTQPNIMVLAQPQLLDSIEPIYPSLLDCRIPIDVTILGSLANPLWLKNLSKHLTTRGIATVGDLARLSARQVDRIPVKGNPRVDFVIKVLRSFEDKLSINSAGKLSIANNNEKNPTDYLALVTDKHSNSIGEHTDDDDDDDDELPTLDVSAVTLPPTQGPLNDSVINSVQDFDPHVRQSIRRTSTTMASVLGNTQTVSQISTIDLISESMLGTTVSVGTSTETLPKPPSKSVGSQMAFEELLDEIDAKLVLHSAVKRCSAETLLAQYKVKMGYMPETELARETMRMLEVDGKISPCEATLKSACRACGFNKVLTRLPDIFSNEKEFFAKLLSAYRDNIQAKDCLENLNIDDIKSEIRRRCSFSVSELTEMLLSSTSTSTSTAAELNGRREHAEAANLSGFKSLLRTIPLDVIISETVANTELIPSSVVLDIGLKNNEVDVVTSAIESRYPEIAENIVDRKMTPERIISTIENDFIAKDKLMSIIEASFAKLSPQELLDACYTALRPKLNENFV